MIMTVLYDYPPFFKKSRRRNIYKFIKQNKIFDYSKAHIKLGGGTIQLTKVYLNIWRDVYRC